VARALGGWLEGPGISQRSVPGSRLGLPAEGPGSVAGVGSRILAYVVDGVIANLLIGLPYLVGVRYSVDSRGLAIYIAFLLQVFILVGVQGQTIGMRLAGIRVVSVAGRGRARWRWVAVRTVLLGLLVPACVWDRDQRGLHDRAAGTVIVRDAPRVTSSTP
jgi:uncharacterized RDD family membrane protein YckC